MRRFAVSLMAAAGTVALASCGGGSVLGSSNTTTPDHVILTVAGPSSVARVLPGGGLAISAVQTHGSQNAILSGNNYRWKAMLTAGGTYVSDALGTQKPCATVTQTVGGVTSPYTADFSLYITIDPVNEANIIYSPPSLIPVPTGVTSIGTNYPYCVVVSAEPGTITGTGLGTTFTPTGPFGSITVAVVDPQNPLQ